MLISQNIIFLPLGSTQGNNQLFPLGYASRLGIAQVLAGTDNKLTSQAIRAS